MDKNKTLIYAIIDCTCNNGMKIAFDDELTSDYEEFVIGLDAE